MNNQTTKKICVVTGTRAEYGLLYWLMKGLYRTPYATGKQALHEVSDYIILVGTTTKECIAPIMITHRLSVKINGIRLCRS